MKLNALEFALMNNPIRSFALDKLELRRIRKLISLDKGLDILEIGCGNGTGSNLITKYFQPNTCTAIDLDEKMITLAKEKFPDKNINFEVGDASKLKYKDKSFDAIFDFGIIHHIPNWKDCLSELHRVLRPGGQLIIEDLSIDTFETLPGKIYRKLLHHPYNEMYTRDEFIAELENLGFKIDISRTLHPLLLIKYFIVIAKKKDA